MSAVLMRGVGQSVIRAHGRMICITPYAPGPTVCVHVSTCQSCLSSHTVSFGSPHFCESSRGVVWCSIKAWKSKVMLANGFVYEI